jgi:hypothetical protein
LEIVPAPRVVWASACKVIAAKERIAAVAAKAIATLRIRLLPRTPRSDAAATSPSCDIKLPVAIVFARSIHCAHGAWGLLGWRGVLSRQRLCPGRGRRRSSSTDRTRQITNWPHRKFKSKQTILRPPQSAASPRALVDALAFALRFSGRKRIHNGDEIMAAIVAKCLVEHLEQQVSSS